MAIELRELLKGSVAQTVAQGLFEKAGYRVARLGIEEVLREVKLHDEKQYRALALPENLRALPDFLVTDKNLSQAFLVEIKFRKTIDSLDNTFCQRIEWQRRIWPGLYVVLLLGESPRLKGRFLQDYVRVIPPTKDLHYITAPQSSLQRWSQLYRLSSSFKLFKVDKFSAFDQAVAALRQLTDV